MSKVRVLVMPKTEVLDPQGKAVESGIKMMGIAGVTNVRLGKVVEFEMNNPKPEQVRDMCERLLANTVIEDYHVEMA